MTKRTGVKWIEVNIHSDERGIGKTTVAMTLVKYLRLIGYKVVYEGIHQHNSRLTEEQIKRTTTDPPHIQEGVVIFVGDKA